MKDQNITTTAGEPFTLRKHAEMARMIFIRWGRDMPAAAAAWRRLYQNSCSDSDFADMVNMAERLPVFISGRLWRDQKAGNTYHSVCIYYSDGTTDVKPFKYGSDFLQTACEILGAPPGESPSRWLRERAGVPRYESVDVSRRKDLHGNGGR